MGSATEDQFVLRLHDVVEYHASSGEWVVVKVISLEDERIQIDAKKGQWLDNAFIKGRLRTHDGDCRPCIIPKPLEGSKVSVEDITSKSTYLQKTFPEFLERFADVATDGMIAWDVFLSLYETTSMPPRSFTDTVRKDSTSSAGGYPTA